MQTRKHMHLHLHLHLHMHYATCNAPMDAWLLILFGKAQRQERQIGIPPHL
jgi:hypothetical protein